MKLSPYFVGNVLAQVVRGSNSVVVQKYLITSPFDAQEKIKEFHIPSTNSSYFGDFYLKYEGKVERLTFHHKNGSAMIHHFRRHVETTTISRDLLEEIDVAWTKNDQKTLKTCLDRLWAS